MNPRAYIVFSVIAGIITFFTVLFAIAHRPSQEQTSPVIYLQKQTLDDGTPCATAFVGGSIALSCNWLSR